VIAAKRAGAACIIISGLARDNRRLEVAHRLGADHTINVGEENLRERVSEITAGQGVDVVVDVAAATEETILPAMDVLNKKRGTLVVAAGKMDQEIANFPIGIVKLKYLTVKAGRGHSYQAVEMALSTIASRNFPLQELCSHKFGLNQVDKAVRTSGNEGEPGAIHVTVAPWQGA